MFAVSPPVHPPKALVNEMSVAIALAGKTKKFHAKTALMVEGKTISTEIWMQIPGKITAKSEYPSTSRNRPDSWTLQLTKEGVFGVDWKRHWYWDQRSKTTKERENLYKELVTYLPEPASLLISPDKMVSTMGLALKSYATWTHFNQDGKSIWAAKNKLARVALTFDLHTHRLLGLEQKLAVKDQSPLQQGWTIQPLPWQDPKPVSAPEGYIRTGVFSLASPYPVFSSSDVSAIAAQSIDLYDHLTQFSATTQSGETKLKVKRNEDKMEVDFATGNWKYGHGVLSWNLNGIEHQEKVGLEKVPEKLTALDLPFNRFIMTNLGGHNFGERSFLQGYEGQIVGSVNLNGKKISIIQLRGPAVEVEISVDSATGFIVELQSTTYNTKGKAISKVDTTYTLDGTTG